MTTTTKINDTKALELNSAYMPLKIISSRRAFVLWYKKKAEIYKEYPTYFKTVKAPYYAKPSIIRIPKFIEVKYDKVPFTKNNVLKRDNYACVYCGSKNRGSLTIDHVIPKSKGGEDTWGNWVTACEDCNSAKADLTLEEWGKEDPKPYRPHSLLLMQKKIYHIPEEWKQFLFL